MVCPRLTQVTYLPWDGWLSAQTSDLGGNHSYFCISSLVPESFIGLSNHIFPFQLLTSNQKAITWVDSSIPMQVILMGSSPFSRLNDWIRPPLRTEKELGRGPVEESCSLICSCWLSFPDNGPFLILGMRRNGGTLFLALDRTNNTWKPHSWGVFGHIKTIRMFPS